MRIMFGRPIPAGLNHLSWRSVATWTSLKEYIPFVGSWRGSDGASGGKKDRLVLLGTGWASYSLLKNLNRKLYDVTVISPRNHFLFTPLLASTTVGTLGFGEKDDFFLSYATKIDLKKRIVTMRSNDPAKVVSDVAYDRLVIGVGALTNTFNVPGADTHAFFLKEILDAQRIRNRILTNFEAALQPGLSDAERQRLLHIVIVGGGPTGVEFGAEVYDFIRADVARLYKKDAALIQVTLVEAQHILQSFDTALQNYAEKKMNERFNFHLLQDSVVRVTDHSVELKSGQLIPCGMVVWSTGLAPRDFVRELDVPKNKNGQILVNEHMQLVEDPIPEGSVFSIGDCSVIRDRALPSTAQVAERQGRYLAKVLSQRDIRTAPPFTFSSMGMLAYLGGYKAVSDLPEFKIQGITSWVLWRSAYLTRLGSLRLRLQVPFDWFKTFFFGRDTSKL